MIPRKRIIYKEVRTSSKAAEGTSNKLSSISISDNDDDDSSAMDESTIDVSLGVDVIGRDTKFWDMLRHRVYFTEKVPLNQKAKYFNSKRDIF